MPKQRMYADRKGYISCIVGCKFGCKYCKSTFQAQMKRQKKNCPLCYEYVPHFHPERLHHLSLPQTEGDEFIWIAPSSDISFAERAWLHQIYEEVIDCYSDRQFFFQTKDPRIFLDIPHPRNLWLGITLESDGIVGYEHISKAPNPAKRYLTILENSGIKIDIVTIEPIINFDLSRFAGWIQDINPQRVYVGYDSHQTGLLEPPLTKTTQLINKLSKFTKVKLKLLREAI